MAESMSVEKNKLVFLHDSTTSFRPGWGGGDMENETGRVCQSKKHHIMGEKWVLRDMRSEPALCASRNDATPPGPQCYNTNWHYSLTCLCLGMGGGGSEGNTSYMGRVSEFQALMRDSLTSTTVTVISGHICAITLHVGPPTYPAPMQQILLIWTIWKYRRRLRKWQMTGLWPDII